jgi:hypothetical protein
MLPTILIGCQEADFWRDGIFKQLQTNVLTCSATTLKNDNNSGQ